MELEDLIERKKKSLLVNCMRDRKLSQIISSAARKWLPFHNKDNGETIAFA